LLVVSQSRSRGGVVNIPVIAGSFHLDDDNRRRLLFICNRLSLNYGKRIGLR